MRGAEQLIAIRSRGAIPPWVGINVGGYPTYGVDEYGNPWIQIDLTENLQRLDLRFLTGLKAEIWARKRRDEVARVCAKAGAEVCVFNHETSEMEPWLNG